MRVLLDENLPRRLKNLLPPGIEGETVRERGWGSIKNGVMLALAQDEFDALLTADQGIPHQHDLSRFDLIVVVTNSKPQRLRASVAAYAAGHRSTALHGGRWRSPHCHPISLTLG